MTAQPSTPLPRFALCAPCGFTFLQTPEQENCPMCAQPPSGVLVFSPGAGGGDPVSLLSPGPPAADPGEPLYFRGICPECETYIRVEITDSTVEWLKDEPEPAAPGDNVAPLSGESVAEAREDAAVEGAAAAVGPADTPSAAAASNDVPPAVQQAAREIADNVVSGGK